MTQTTPSPNPGRDFELHVAILYERNGYKTERNQNLAGQQIDIVAQKNVPGIGITKIAIECKFRSEGSISNQDVIDFINQIKVIQLSHPIDFGVLVTNAEFSAAAK